MNRENKRKQYEKGYYRTHACHDSFTCKVCGWMVGPNGAGSDHRNHCPNCLHSLHVDEEPGDRASWCRWNHGADCRLGEKKRRVGNHPPLSSMWQAFFQSSCRR